MNTFGRLNGKIASMRHDRILDQLVKPGLRSRVGPETIGFAGQEPVKDIRDDGTLVLYDGALIVLANDDLQELKPRAGYRIWERMASVA
jgi:hypothetical protein